MSQSQKSRKTTASYNYATNCSELFDRVKKTRQPIILMRDSKADIALIDTKTLSDLQKTGEMYEALLDAMSDVNLEQE